AEMGERGCAGGAIEVAFEAPEGRGLEGLAPGAAVVTGLGEGSKADRQGRRVRAARLFRAIATGGVAVVNADDPDAEVLGGVNLDARRGAFGLQRSAGVSAGIHRPPRTGSAFP